MLPVFMASSIQPTVLQVLIITSQVDIETLIHGHSQFHYCINDDNHGCMVQESSLVIEQSVKKSSVFNLADAYI